MRGTLILFEIILDRGFEHLCETSDARSPSVRHCAEVGALWSRIGSFDKVSVALFLVRRAGLCKREECS
jgi:hypothetical protein